MQQRQENLRCCHVFMERLFLHILHCTVTGEELKCDCLRKLSGEDWRSLYCIAKQQGLTAVTFEKIKPLPKELAPPREVALKWMSHAFSIEKQTMDIAKKCARFAQLMHEHGLYTLVLKGIAMSQYFPNPWHREYGDLDCYLYRKENDDIIWDGCYEEGNCIAEHAGYEVKREHYKHSHINYEGLEIENHQFSLAIKDGKNTKALERELRRKLAAKTILHRVGDTHLYCPSADFNALFLTAHAMSHFLYESIKLRHVMDWALFLKAEQDKIDWRNFWYWCDKMHYTRFVQCLNYICVHQFGLQIHAFTVEESEMTKRLATRILQDIFEGDSLYAKGYKGLRFRIALATSYFKSMWKFHRVYQHSALWLLAKRAMGMLVNDVKLGG